MTDPFEDKKEFDVKSAFTITGILIFALAICFGLLFYQSTQQEKRMDIIEDNAISKRLVATMCLNENCTYSALVINTSTE